MKLLPIRKKGFLILVALCAAATAYFAMPQTKPLVTTSVAMTAPAAHSEPIFPASFPMPQTKPPATTATTAAKATPAAASNPTFQKTIGNPSAPITMEVFGDFQCPACRGFFEGTVKQVIDDYVIPGKVYLIHRDFPLEMHPYARQAARFANAAAEFGQFEAVERALYDHQDEWSAKGNIEEVMASYFPPAQFKKFQAFETSHVSEINASIERDHAMGMQRNVNQTPTVYITSKGKTEALPGGGVDYKLLKSYFDYLLRQ